MEPQNQNQQPGAEAPVTPAPETNLSESTEGEGVMTHEAPTTTSEVKRGPSRIAIAALIIVAGALIAGGYYFLNSHGEENGPVAIVNGFKIAREEFNESVAMIQQTASLQGADISDPATLTAINDQALDILVNNTLLIEGAKEAGITASPEEIQAEYDTLVASLGGQEELNVRMAEVGLTEEKLRSNISDRIVVDSYIEAETDIENVSVTEEEIQTFIDSLEASGQDLPPTEVLAPQVEQELLNQKRAAIVNEFLTALRDKATIEINI